MLSMTKHAQKRAQQRSISPFVAELIMRHGDSVRRHGANKHFLSKAGRRKIKRELGRRIYSRIEDQINCYVIERDDGAIITMGHRTKRIRR